MIHFKCAFLKKHIKSISILLMFILILPYIKLWVSMDESYTLDLVHNSYKMIIAKDMLDIHPPLYYLLLKFFFSITLFWKHSIISEIIMGRLFSVLCSLFTVHYLIKINDKLGIFINKHVQYIIFFLLPIVLFAENINLSPSISVRMYALSGLFVTLVCYHLACYLDNENIADVVFMTIFSILAEYTHYYAAVTAGLVLLFMFLICLFEKNIKMMLSFLFSGIIFLIAYLPWILYAIPRQFSTMNFGQPLFKTLFWIAFAAAILIAFTIPLLSFRKFISSSSKKYCSLLLTINITILIFATGYSLIKSPVFLFRYIYPSLVPLLFFVVSLIVFNILNKKVRIKWSVILLALIFIGAIGSYTNEIVKVLPMSVGILKNDKYFGEQKTKYVNIDKMKYSVVDYNINHSYMSDDVQVGIYLQSIGKIPYVTTKKNEIYNNNFAVNPHTMHKFIYFKNNKEE